MTANFPDNIISLRSWIFFILSFLVPHPPAVGIIPVVVHSTIYSRQKYTSIYKNQGALVQNIDFSSVEELRLQLNKIYGLELRNRGEAHITMITPPEFTETLAPYMTADDLHELFKLDIQSSKFKVVCIGERRSDREHRVFFLVIESEDLLRLRNKLRIHLEKISHETRPPPTFLADKYWPHITIGYLVGDVHGVSKGPETCVPDLELIFQK